MDRWNLRRYLLDISEKLSDCTFGTLCLIDIHSTNANYKWIVWNIQNRLFCMYCGVPKDSWMVKISPGPGPGPLSPSEKNVHTVLLIQLGQKTTWISNRTPCWAQSKQRNRDDQRRINTCTNYTAPLGSFMYPVPQSRLNNREICLKCWNPSGLSKSIV